ncbi:MAG TPA: hypothetical protein VJ953_21050 [Saprospiraceae bacterium]|nr:hypothetical protein [Saprospiraceae bacterium]
MRKAIFLFCCLSILVSSCDQLGNRNNKRLDPETLGQTLPGTWRLSQAGAEEIWHFSGDRTYVKIKRFEEEFGTWGIKDAGLVMAEQTEASATPYDVLLDGNVLILGEEVSLLKDSLAVRDVEARLSEKLIGKWKASVGEEVYQFMPNGYMLIQYEDEMTEDGSWRFTGNQLIENDAAVSAAPVFFDGNQMQWSTQRFTRIGDVSAEDIPEAARVANVTTKGQVIEQHRFDANLGNFGQVTFAPYWEDRYGESQVNYYLLRNGNPVYAFPDFAAAKGRFDGLRAVSARDVNSDGKLDIVIMADYLPEGAGLNARANTINGIFINKDNSFSFDSRLSNQINSNSDINSINDIVKALRTKTTASRPATNSGGTAKGGSGTNLNQYKGDKTICRIRVASLEGTIDFEEIGKLANLGVLSFEPADNGFTRVYLGNYLGKYAAYKVLQQVKRKGYPSAFVVADQNFLENVGEETASYSTYQIYASKQLDVTPLNEIPEKYREQVYISHNGSNYRVSLGIYQKDLYPYEEQTYVGLSASLGYTNGFSNTIN